MERALFIRLLLIMFLIPQISCSNQTEVEPQTSSSDFDEMLDWFDRDTRDFMESDPGGETVSPGGELIRKEILDAKDESRLAIMKAAEVLSVQSSANEKIENLIDARDLNETGGRILRNPVEMDELGLREMDLRKDAKKEAWSSSIYNQYRGHTALRYADGEAADASSWQKAWAYFSESGNTFLDVVNSGDEEALDDLSPAEKYDLLITEPSQSPMGVLTEHEWRVGRERLEQSGEVPKWHGYCHGWAPAAITVPRPLNAIRLPTADGSRTIKFYPDDIKALNIALWANALPKIRMLGGRCNEKDPARDENGRVISENCVDSNPGTFHMALVNQLAIAKRNLLIDATYDRQVWNQPIVSYKYRYFNPQTRKSTRSIEKAVISLEDFTKDKFRYYRSPEAKRVLGIALEIEYVKTSTPRHREADDADNDRLKKVKYLYDLELNENNEIIGGEWYQLRHPDFMWVPVKDAKAKSDFENELRGDWNPLEPVPVTWRGPALKSGQRGQPLAKIVEAMNSMSQSPTN